MRRRRRNLARLEHLLEGQSVPNLEKIPNFRYSPSWRSLCRIGDNDFLNDENVLDEVRSHPRFHLQRGMRESRDSMEEVVLAFHFQSLVGRDLEIGGQRSLDYLLDEGLTKLDKRLLLEAFPDGTSVPSRSGLRSGLRKVKRNVSQRHRLKVNGKVPCTNGIKPKCMKG